MYNTIFIRGSKLPSEIPFTENHIHTRYTDGQNTIDEYINSALQLGLKSIIFTEHVHRNSSWFEEYITELEKAKEKYNGKIKIFTGIEAKALDYDGTIDATDDMIKACDVVVGVVHRYPNPKGGIFEFEEVDSSISLDLEYKAAKGLLEKGSIDVLGHPGGTYEYKFGPFPNELYRKLFETAAEKDRVIELNARYHSRLKTLVKYCRQYNLWVSLGSDVHELNHLGNIYRQMLEVEMD